MSAFYRKAWAITGSIALVHRLTAAGQQPVAYVARPDLAIDGVANQLVGVSWIGVWRDGAIVVAPGANRDVHFFSAEGKVRSFDPSPSDRAFVARGFVGDTVWGYDPTRSTLTFISPTLQRVRTLNLPSGVTLPSGDAVALSATMGSPVLPLAYEPDETILVSVVSRAVPESWHRPPRGFDVVLRVTATGLVRAVVGWPESSGDECYKHAVVIPFCLSPVLSVASDGHAVASARAFTAGPDSGQIIVSMIRATGDTIYSERYPYVARKVSKHDADSAVSWLKAMPGAHFDRIDSLVHPTIYPPLVSMTIGNDGSAWLEQPPDGSSTTWLVIDPAGRLSRTVTVPTGIRIRAVAGDIAWGSRRDSPQTSSVIRLKITPAR